MRRVLVSAVVGRTRVRNTGESTDVVEKDLYSSSWCMIMLMRAYIPYCSCISALFTRCTAVIFLSLPWTTLYWVMHTYVTAAEGFTADCRLKESQASNWSKVYSANARPKEFCMKMATANSDRCIRVAMSTLIAVAKEQV